MKNKQYEFSILKRFIRVVDLKINALVFVIFMSSYSYGQELYYEQFTEADGLPSMMTYEMAQDSNGILWVGTENGLVSYDGEEFQNYTHPKLIDHDIIEIALDKYGRVYFLNLSYQFGYVEEDVVHLIDTEQLEEKVVNIIASENSVYVDTRSLDGSRIMELVQDDKDQFSFVDTDVNCFIIENHKYTKAFRTIKSNGSWLIISDSSKVKMNPVQDIEYKRESIFYSSEKRHEIIEVDSAINQLLNLRSPMRFVKSFDKSFMIFNNGIELYDAQTDEFYSLLKSKLVSTVFIDDERNIWVTTQNEGLLKIPHIDFQLKSKIDKLSQGYGISSFIHDDFGNIYLGTTTGQVFIYSKDGDLIKKVLDSPKQKEVSFQKDGDNIYGGSDPSFVIINQKTLEHKHLKHEKVGFKSFAFLNDTVYIGTRNGILKSRLKDYEKIDYTGQTISLLRGHWINNILVDDSSKSFYAGTSTGLFKIDPSGKCIPIFLDGKKEYNVSSIIRSDQNSIWIGTRSSGVIKLRNDTIIERYNTSNGLISNNVNSLTISNNKLIVSTVDGVGIKDIVTNEKRTINEFGGIIPKEILHCDIVDNDYWLATNDGLKVVKEDQLKYFKKGGPTLSVKNIYANGDKIDINDDLKFSHNINNIQINFRNVSLQNGNNKSIKYRILSSDSSWQFSKDPLIRLQSLKHGTYSIEAIGLNSLKDEGNKIALKFTVTPPWWQTTWARILGILLAFLIIRLIINYRTKRIRKEENTTREYLTQINKIKDQALQLQMNPHFIFNSLNAIQGFIGTEEEEKAMIFLARFAHLIRLIFEFSKGSSISLEEELEFVNLYLSLEKLRFKDKVDIKVIVEENADSIKDFVRIAPLLVQPIIENSFKHGLFHKTEKGSLLIHYSLVGDVLKVVVEDDGIGRKRSKEIAKKNFEKQMSSGIKTTLERIEILNYETGKNINSMQIEDLYHADGNAMGTRTTFMLSI